MRTSDAIINSTREYGMPYVFISLCFNVKSYLMSIGLKDNKIIFHLITILLFYSN